MQRVGQNAFAKFRHLHIVLDDDGVLANEIDAAHMAVEIDANAGPVEACRHLLDMGRFAGAVIALDHDAPVVLEAGENGQRHVAVEQVVRVKLGNMFFALAVSRDFEVGIDAEDLPDRNGHIGRGRPFTMRSNCHAMKFQMSCAREKAGVCLLPQPSRGRLP